jgi:hypothetical protein
MIMEPGSGRGVGLAIAMFAALFGCGSERDSGGVDAATADGSSTPDAPPGAKHIFITRQTYLGSLASGSGLAGGDAACGAAAQAAQHGGSWKAWLSTTTADAIDRIVDVGPWYDVRGTLVFADKANLTTSPLASLWYDEFGASLASDKIWTGTGYGGRYIAALSGTSPCEEWTSSAMADQAKVGQVGRQDGAVWTAQSNTTCNQDAHLICIEQ